MKTLKRIWYKSESGRLMPLTALLLVWLVIALGVALRWEVEAQEPTDSLAASGWLHQDVGVTSGAGNAWDSNGVFAVTSGGLKIWETSDSFHYVFQPLTGNGQIVARVLGIQGANGSVKAGVMMRENLDSGSRNVTLSLLLNKRLLFQWRSVQDWLTDSTVGTTNQVAPCWMKLVRWGDWLGGYSSADGTNWTLAGWQNVDGLADQVYVGLAVASRLAGSFCTAQFDQVSVGQANQPQAVFPAVGTGDGLSASYFDNRDLQGVPVIQRVDPEVDFDFIKLIHRGAAATNAAAFADNSLRIVGKPDPSEFSVSWSGKIQAQFSEPYTFHMDSDDGARVWLDEQVILDHWLDGDTNNASAPVNLVAGQKYSIHIQYYQNQLHCHARLKWSSPSTSLRMVPQSQLYSALTTAGAHEELRYIIDSINVPTSGVTNEWFYSPIGIQVTGDTRYSNGVLTVTSSGLNQKIWENSDSFYYVFQPLTGNGQIVARVLGIQGASELAKAGVMIRETLGYRSRNALVSLLVNQDLFFQWRSERDSFTDSTVGTTNQVAPCWMKLVRWGDWLGGYSSADGTNWTLAGWQNVDGLADQVYVGLAVASRLAGSFCTAQFDQVSVGQANQTEVVSPMTGTGDGLRGDYYTQECLYGPSVTNQIDPVVSFDWTHGEPMGLAVGDPFGVCWTGEIQAQFSEPYTFELASKSENWMRLWINEQLVVDSWKAWHPEGADSGTINLVAGQHYLLRVEYYNAHAQAVASLRWSSPSTPLCAVPQSQLYSQPKDTDGKGLPDLWQLHYFGHLGVDPNADPDGDGLSNLQEYQYHTNPLKSDTSGDGIPDGWKIAHCLDPWTNLANAADPDHDGLTILQEYQLGLDPNAVDTGGADGLPFGLVYKYLGNPTNLNGLVTEALVVNGAQGTNTLGGWQVDGTDMYAVDRRGAVEFNLTVGNPDKFVLKLIGTQNQNGSPQTSFNLLLSIDGESLGHRTLTAGYGTNGVIDIVTPYLKAGAHRVRVFWDDAASASSLRIKQVKLLSIAGPDSNGNGIKDWVEQMLADESGLDLTNAVIGSSTSPVCLEGRDPYLSMLGMRVAAGGTTNPVAVRHNAGLRWYADVALSPQTNTDIGISYQNDGRMERRRLKWLPTNVLHSSNLVIRVGDSLLLKAAPAGATNGVSQITVANGTQIVASYSGLPPSSLISQPFGTADVYTVSSMYQSGNQTRSGTVTVRVIGYKFPDSPACVMDYGRNWTLTNVPSGSVIEADPRMTESQTNLPNGDCQMLLVTDQNELRTIISRPGSQGPILDSAKAEGLRLFTALDTYNQVITNYTDGSRLVETMEVLSPVLTNVIVRIDVIVGGVTLDDGTTSRQITASDFDELGQYKVRFILPRNASTANCHHVSVWQGTERIAEY